MERYTKNHQVRLWSIHVSRSRFSLDAQTIPAVSTFKIKNTNVDNIWEFYFRLCANGSCQVQGKDFDLAHSPTGSYDLFQMLIALASCLRRQGKSMFLAFIQKIIEFMLKFPQFHNMSTQVGHNVQVDFLLYM